MHFQTKRSSDDLQTELFDLIGFERIELIQLLLEHRDELVREHALNKSNMKQEIMSAAASKSPLMNLLTGNPTQNTRVILQCFPDSVTLQKSHNNRFSQYQMNSQ